MKWIPAAACVLLLTSCTVTRVSTPNWTLTRCSILQKVDVPTLTVDAAGKVHLSGYKNDGGGEEMNQFIISTLKLLEAMPVK